MEAALGMLYFKRLMVAMKHVGLNVAADVFMNSAQPVASDLLHIGKADIFIPNALLVLRQPIIFYLETIASTSSTVFGIGFPRIRKPSSVTKISSSILIPPKLR